MLITILTGGPDAATGPVPDVDPLNRSNQEIQDLYTSYGYLVRQGLAAYAVRLTLQGVGAIPQDVTSTHDLSSSYRYFDYLSELVAQSNSGWMAFHADTLAQVPAGGVVVFNATSPGAADPRNGCTAMGYTHGHVMVGSVYNGDAGARGNWLGGGLAGGTYFLYTR